MAEPVTEVVECDVLVVGGGMSGCVVGGMMRKIGGGVSMAPISLTTLASGENLNAAIASSSEMISPASKVFLEPALKSADGVFITIAVSSIAVKVRCGRDIDSF